MNALADRVAGELRRRGWRLITAESCTGGLIASTLTSIPGSSEWFEGGFVTYQPRTKIRLLGVSPETIERYTVVSEPVARAMALGALERSDAEIAVSVTGVAGPGGGDVVTPVGTVWLAWALKDPEPACVQASEFEFDGDRASVRDEAVHAALDGLARALANSSG
ncbi:MAG: CinA family protein [Gammaproteobacteria bacterium]|nr:CinA family protein [Gammaproteobacteria bacterium]